MNELVAVGWYGQSTLPHGSANCLSVMLGGAKAPWDD